MENQIGLYKKQVHLAMFSIDNAFSIMPKSASMAGAADEKHQFGQSHIHVHLHCCSLNSGLPVTYEMLTGLPICPATVK